MNMKITLSYTLGNDTSYTLGNDTKYQSLATFKIRTSLRLLFQLAMLEAQTSTKRNMPMNI